MTAPDSAKQAGPSAQHNAAQQNAATSHYSRREFIQATGTAAVVGAVAPAFLHAEDKAGTQRPVLGKGEHTYQVEHNWGQLPDSIRWGETHGVAVDAAGQIYVKHRATSKEPMDAIVVFDPAGKYVRSFGKEYHGGGHGIDIRKEGNEEYLYLCDVKNREFSKTNLQGEQVWKKGFPEEAKLGDKPCYEKKEQFNPTNIAFAPDGGFYVADGYGSHFVHQYDSAAKYVRTFGGQGTTDGKFRTPHGIWWDNRPGREPALVVADRANARLQYFSADGAYQRTVANVSFPAHFDTRGTDLLIPDLHARVSIFNDKNEVLVHLGDDPEWTKEVLKDGMKLRREPQRWVAGKFVHPHDACFDAAGNIFVVEWVPTGRVSRLQRVS